MNVDKCSACDTLAVPPAYTCAQCGGTKFEATAVSGRGSLYTFTTIRVPPAEFANEAPYIFAVVELEEGLLLPARLDAAKEDGAVEIGAAVELVSEDERGALFRLS